MPFGLALAPQKKTQNDLPPIRFRKPRTEDGSEVWNLVKRIGNLDDNSMYCNLLQCSHFSDTCAVAECDGDILGWVSGYLPPGSPDTLFVWQVAVAPAARGRGVGKNLIRALLARERCRGVRHIHSTITRGNEASWALFTSIAEELGAPVTHDAHFEEDAHFDGAQPTEHLVEIGPFHRAALRRAA